MKPHIDVSSRIPGMLEMTTKTQTPVISIDEEFRTIKFNKSKSNRCVDNKMECICSGQYTF